MWPFKKQQLTELDIYNQELQICHKRIKELETTIQRSYKHGSEQIIIDRLKFHSDQLVYIRSKIEELKSPHSKYELLNNN